MTIQFDLSDAESYKLYFEVIAETNKLLGVGQHLYGDIEIGVSEASVWQGRKLWAWPATKANGAGQNDNYYLNREGSIWIGGPCESEKFVDQDIYYFQCEKIMKQVVSKLLFDFENSELALSFSRMQLQRQDMTLGATKFIGCELIFFFADPDDLEYNENDWL